MMRLVIVESPYAGPMMRENVEYARRCIADCLRRGEAPFAAHLLYTQKGVLDDDDPDQRALGVAAGFAWAAKAAATVVYVDRGISRGMQAGVLDADNAGRPVLWRSLKPIHPLAVLLEQDRKEHERD